MSFVLLRSAAFARSAKRHLKKNPDQATAVESALELLTENPFDPRLKSHRLTGKLKASWACSAGYDLRIIFSFARHGNSNAILLETMGTHDEVY